MDKAIETNGIQMFSVPNTEEGQIFLELANKFLNRKRFIFRKKTRCRDRRAVYDRMLAEGAIKERVSDYTLQSNAPPMPYCDWVAVYAVGKGNQGGWPVQRTIAPAGWPTSKT